MTLKEKYDEYVKQHIFEPKFAEATIIWNDTKERVSGMIFKLSCDLIEDEDDFIFFYLNDYTDFESFRTVGSEDFTVDIETVEFFEKL